MTMNNFIIIKKLKIILNKKYAIFSEQDKNEKKVIRILFYYLYINN